MMMTMMTDEVMADGATMALDTETCRPVSGGPYPVLPYRVAECSSYSAGYRPELVCEDRPTDQASRWSSATNDQHQFITLRLEQPALLVATITFGKFHKNHVCNMREFKVFVRATNDIADTPISGAAMGMAATTTTTTMTMAAVPGVGGDLSTSTAGWTEVLHSGLRNDSEPECFPLQYPIRQIPLDDTGEEEEEEQRQQQQQQQLISSFHPSPSPSLGPLRNYQLMPVHYVKIQPLAAWGNSFNYSIWHVELRGVSEPSIVGAIAMRHQARVLRESWRICLKFLREHSEETFRSLEQRMPIPLEDPLVSRLYELLVNRGAFGEAEGLLTCAHQRDPSLFTPYVEAHIPYEPRWTRLDVPSSPNGTPVNASTIAMAAASVPPPIGDSTGRPGDDNRMPPMPMPTSNTLTAVVTSSTTPTVRGGHQMCWDGPSKSIYLLGGWDGHRDLGDFWRYSLESASWTCLSEDTRREGGPGPRSCHKIVIHSGLRRLYVLGRYLDTESRSQGTFAADFYYYDLDQHTWTRLSDDVQMQGGPGLVYDHQMAIDESALMGSDNGGGGGGGSQGVIYVFGGRLISAANGTPGSLPEAVYSGLYAYDIGQDQWRLLRDDSSPLSGTPIIKARIGHSMIFNPTTRQIYIYAGQRHKDYLCDFYVYDVDSDTVVEMVKDTSRIGGPDAGFTQRSTLDVHRQELFLFSGLMREKTPTSTASGGNSNSSGGAIQGTLLSSVSASSNNGSGVQSELARNSFWLYSLGNRRWTRIYTNESSSSDEPCPRFAHQLVYDAHTGLHYLFGGNPGEPGAPRRRLGDFWQLQLVRPAQEADILRRALFLLRRQQFYELCVTRHHPEAARSHSRSPGSPSMVNAMRFLQSEVAVVVNHANGDESREFRQLSSWLLAVPGLESQTSAEPAALETLVRRSRLRLFTELVALLPPSMRPPTVSIADLL